MIKKDELKNDDFVMYVSEAKLDQKEGHPLISLSVEKILKLNDDTFDIKDKTQIKRYRISKVIRNGKFENYEEHDEIRIYKDLQNSDCGKIQ
jgi:hypothetical protein